MRSPARSTITSLAAIVISASVAFTAGSIVNASSSPEPVTYYACLRDGTLRRVGTIPPTCGQRSQQISWNQTGPAGSPGAPGAPGARGPQGEPGEPGEQGALDTFIVLETKLFRGSASRVEDYASCPDDSGLIGGGATVSTGWVLSSSSPSLVGGGSQEPNVWRVEVNRIDTSSTEVTINAFAICATGGAPPRFP